MPTPSQLGRKPNYDPGWLPGRLSQTTSPNQLALRGAGRKGQMGIKGQPGGSDNLNIWAGPSGFQWTSTKDRDLMVQKNGDSYSKPGIAGGAMEKRPPGGRTGSCIFYGPAL